MKTVNAQEWEVVVWVSPNKGTRRTFSTREEAYLWANEHLNAHVLEVYGPDGYYDAN
jgi:hypothetical protein